MNAPTATSPSTPTQQTRKEFLAALAAFTEAAQKLHTAFGPLTADDSNRTCRLYPFAVSFDVVVEEVEGWGNDLSRAFADAPEGR